MITGDRIKRALTTAGIPEFLVSVEASNVTRSPYPYVYVWLSPDRHEGRHILISALAEYEPDSPDDVMLIGLWTDHADEDPSTHELVLEQAVQWAFARYTLDELEK